MNFGSSIVTFPVCWIVFCLLRCCISWLLILAGKWLARGQSSLGDCVCLWRPSDEVLFQYMCCGSEHWWGALLCLSLPKPFGMWHVWPGVTLHLSLMFCLLLLTDYANQAPPRPPFAVSRPLDSHREPGSSSLSRLWALDPWVSHVGFGTKPSAGHLFLICHRDTKLLPSHCCCFRTPRGFSSLILSLESENVFPSIFF